MGSPPSYEEVQFLFNIHKSPSGRDIGFYYAQAKILILTSILCKIQRWIDQYFFILNSDNFPSILMDPNQPVFSVHVTELYESRGNSILGLSKKERKMQLFFTNLMLQKHDFLYPNHNFPVPLLCVS